MLREETNSKKHEAHSKECLVKFIYDSKKKTKQLYNLGAINIYVILKCQGHTFFEKYMVKSYTKDTFKLSSSSKKFK